MNKRLRWLRRASELAMLSILFAAACSSGSSSTDLPINGPAGAGGDSGSAGSSGVGGSNTSAPGGMSGVGGMSGSTTAGTAGMMAGSGGQAGSSAGGAGAAGALVCPPTFEDCNGDASDGCEAKTTTDKENCGKCSKVCIPPPNSAPSCVGGKCAYECLLGFADCDGKADNGCEINLSNDPNNCKSCGTKCPTLQNGSPACSGGECIGVCQIGYGNCSDVIPGCETNIYDNKSHCGLCNNVCPNNGACLSGICQCTGTTQTAIPNPLDIYVMLDRSGSMVNGGRWNPVKSALKSFFASAEAAGISVALQFFDQPSSTCNVNTYLSPWVPFGELPGSNTGHAALLNSTLDQGAVQSKNGVVTPTAAALNGAIQFARIRKIQNPKNEVIVVLATDGLPSASCSGQTSGAVLTLATAGYNSDPPIRTYVIGIDPGQTEFNTMQGWANAAGGQFFNVGTGGGSSQFLNAMKAIQKSVLNCEYSLPTPPMGEQLNFSKVNVVYTPTGSSTASLPNFPDPMGCANSQGWYYDNAQTPTKILLCPQSCNSIKQDFNAKLEILIGCETVKE
jgi:hypothetical protein